MFRMIRCGRGFDPVIVVSPADAGPNTLGAKYYRWASWKIGGHQPGMFNEISRDEAMDYFSGMADGLGFEALPEALFPTLDDTLRYITKKQGIIKVLIIEDDEDCQENYNYWFTKNGVLPISAFSISEAKEQFAAHSDIAAIVVDACVPGNEPNTAPLVRKFRETFSGPMIAVSSKGEFRRQLMEAGCNYESLKEDLHNKLFEVLGLVAVHSASSR